MLIVFGGLPGVGKTALARAVAQELAAAYLRVDAIEAAMRRAGLLTINRQVSPHTSSPTRSPKDR
jgi:predicted kinase